ncbi:hypothetical protein AMK16_15710 [Streptomyces sp. CB00455]|uniref:hypothetical protein n=1 Tax=Streptomyces sp. CB00455 TaxID=1703927 RepID=UPI00093C550D|nr:hypothetical protein [Streptomyces sp. CB00455]OKK19537.1 hypothetical protein AMK16_15710 [Streptomyces sp. CB00455]
MSKARRIIGMAVATAMAGALPMLAASPAQATSGDCTNYMRNLGYNVRDGVISACNHGEGGFVGAQVCFGMLIQLGVKYDDANEACYQAARD